MRKIIFALAIAAASVAVPAYALDCARPDESNLTRHDCYTNSSGNVVHSPSSRVDPKQAPVDSTATCGDGTTSYSQHRSGTCSHHGGVAHWNK
jgi:hypothetical protein